MITCDELKAKLLYDAATGEFTRARSGFGCLVGQKAGSPGAHGYWRIHLGGTRANGGRDYLAHRLAWLYMTGAWPIRDLDHINGVKDDNKWSNLREATKTENQGNRKVSRNNKTGCKGIYFDSVNSQFVAQLVKHGRAVFLGRYDSLEDAKAAYAQAASSYFGRFARLT